MPDHVAAERQVRLLMARWVQMLAGRESTPDPWAEQGDGAVQEACAPLHFWAR